MERQRLQVGGTCISPNCKDANSCGQSVTVSPLLSSLKFKLLVWSNFSGFISFKLLKLGTTCSNGAFSGRCGEQGVNHHQTPISNTIHSYKLQIKPNFFPQFFSTDNNLSCLLYSRWTSFYNFLCIFLGQNAYNTNFFTKFSQFFSFLTTLT